LLIITSVLMAFALLPHQPEPRAAQMPITTTSTCIDAATPLEVLALRYTWPPNTDAEIDAAMKTARRFFETGDDVTYGNALHQFQKLARERHASTSIQLPLGLLYATGPDLNPKGSMGYRHRLMMADALADNAGAHAFQSVIDHDPSQWLAAIGLTHIGIATREKDRTREALQAIQKALSKDPTNTTLLLAKSDLLVSQSRAAEALELLSGVADACAPVRAARAEAMILTDDTVDGARAYRQALAAAEPSELDRFYDDIRVISTVDELNDYKEAPAQERRAWIRNFWDRSAAKSGITIEARVVEQFQRAAYAHAHYRRAKYVDPTVERIGSQPGDIGGDGYSIVGNVPDVVLMNPVPWDDRGLVYMHQGAPDTVLRSLTGILTRIPDNQIWVYTRNMPPRVFAFTRTLGPDFHFSSNIGCGHGLLASMAYDNTVPGRNEMRGTGNPGGLEAREFYNLMANFDPRYAELGAYCGLASVNGGNPQRFRDAARAIGKSYRAIMDTVVHTESAVPSFRNRMRMLIAAYAFRDARGQPELTALSWIPNADLRDSTSVDKLHLTYTLVDAKDAPLRHDTTVTVPPTQGTGMMRTATTWRDVAFDKGRLLIVANDAADHTHGISATKDVTLDLGLDALSMSDLVIGEPDAAGLLARGSLHISPLPEHAITSGSDFRLFYEVYGVAAGDSITTSIRITRNEQKSIAELLRLYPGRKDSRELAFGKRVELDGRGISVQDVTVGGDLLPGQYTLVATVTTPRGIVRGSTKLLVDAPRK
jgi:tetratricopeptide (TPR) repeat protein